MEAKPKKEWFRTWFNSPYYHVLYANRDEKEAEAFIRELGSYLMLKKDAKILDLACGKGRHSVQLNKLGYEVWGIDLSEKSIEAAKKQQNSKLHFDVFDMRKSYKPDFFDCIFNLFTSFGYFKDVESHKFVLQAIASNLKPGGYFVLDYLNVITAAKKLPEVKEIQSGNINFNIKKLIINDKIVKHISFKDKGKQYRYKEELCWLTLKDFTNLFYPTNLQIIKTFGDYELNPFDYEKSSRLIIIAKKQDA